MKVNHKNMYVILKQQHKALSAVLNPTEVVENVNEIPDNFNQVGWDITIDKLQIMIDKMKALRDRKGKRLTPQFYRSIYNRALIGTSEIDKLNDTLDAANESDIDYEKECIRLNAEIYEMNKEIAEKSAE